MAGESSRPRSGSDWSLLSLDYDAIEIITMPELGVDLGIACIKEIVSDLCDSDLTQFDPLEAINSSPFQDDDYRDTVDSSETEANMIVVVESRVTKFKRSTIQDISFKKLLSKSFYFTASVVASKSDIRQVSVDYTGTHESPERKKKRRERKNETVSDYMLCVWQVDEGESISLTGVIRAFEGNSLIELRYYKQSWNNMDEFLQCVDIPLFLAAIEASRLEIVIDRSKECGLVFYKDIDTPILIVKEVDTAVSTRTKSLIASACKELMKADTYDISLEIWDCYTPSVFDLKLLIKVAIDIAATIANGAMKVKMIDGIIHVSLHRFMEFILSNDSMRDIVNVFKSIKSLMSIASFWIDDFCITCESAKSVTSQLNYIVESGAPLPCKELKRVLIEELRVLTTEDYNALFADFQFFINLLVNHQVRALYAMDESDKKMILVYIYQTILSYRREPMKHNRNAFYDIVFAGDVPNKADMKGGKNTDIHSVYVRLLNVKQSVQPTNTDLFIPEFSITVKEDDLTALLRQILSSNSTSPCKALLTNIFSSQVMVSYAEEGQSRLIVFNPADNVEEVLIQYMAMLYIPCAYLIQQHKQSLENKSQMQKYHYEMIPARVKKKGFRSVAPSNLSDESYETPLPQQPQQRSPSKRTRRAVNE